MKAKRLRASKRFGEKSARFDIVANDHRGHVQLVQNAIGPMSVITIDRVQARAFVKFLTNWLNEGKASK